MAPMNVNADASSHMRTVYALVVMYAICYQLQAPLEPFLVDRLKGASSFEDAGQAYAQLRSFFNFVQMIGSLIVGHLLDRVGLRAMFALNFVSCAASYALLARASSIEMLWLSKVPSMFMAGFLCAQAAAAKLTPEGPTRASALGRLTSAYTIGGSVGPALGGYVGVNAAASLAVAGSVCSIGLVLLLPSAIEEGSSTGKPDEDGASRASASQPRISSRLHTIFTLTWPLLLSKMASGVINSGIGAARPLLLKDEFHFDAARLGMFMSAGFVGSALVGLRLGALTEWLGGPRPTILRCLVGMCAAHALLVCTFERSLLDLGRRHTPDGGVWVYAGLSFAASLFQFPLATILTAMSTQLVPACLKGTLVGCEHATFAVANVIGPTLGVACLQWGGLAGIASVASVGYFALTLVWALRVDIFGDRAVPVGVKPRSR